MTENIKVFLRTLGMHISKIKVLEVKFQAFIEFKLVIKGRNQCKFVTERFR